MNAPLNPPLAAEIGLNCRALALLIDGENLPAHLAPRALTAARQMGPVSVFRVYGDARKLGDWHDVPGARLVHAHAGKNVTDMLMTVEAMEISQAGVIDGFALATSDRDFTPLVQSLRARGFPVLGLLGAQAPAALTDNVSFAYRLTPAATPAQPTLERLAASLLADGSLRAQEFSKAMIAAGHRIPDGSSSWKIWLAKTFVNFATEGSGQETRYGLRKP